MASIQYELNCGQYVLHRDGAPVHAPLDAVAISYSHDDSGAGAHTRHRHGDPMLVKAWVAQQISALRAGGPSGCELADELRVIEGAFPVEILNEAINGTHRALQELIDRAGAIDVVAHVVSESSDAEEDVADQPHQVREAFRGAP